MALNLVKLCVGVDSVEQLQGWLDRHDGQPTVHTTHMTPKRKSVRRWPSMYVTEASKLGNTVILT